MNESFFYLATIIISALTCLIAILGVIIGLVQWSKRTKYKRIEIVTEFFEKVRSNNSVTKVMTMIDWNDYFEYDGSFKQKKEQRNLYDIHITDKELFNYIDEKLSIFDYMIFLLKTKVLSDNDLIPFEYNITRLFQNLHIANYLFSLYHWCIHLNVKCSFYHLIEFGLKKGLLLDNFRDINSKKYKCFLYF